MKVVFILVISFALLSCKTESIREFKQVVNLTNYRCVFSDKNQPLNTIIGMSIVDSILILQHVSDEYNFSFVDVNSGKLLLRWGKTGRGPGEYVEVGSGFTVFESQLVFLDGANNEINYVPISELLYSQDSLEVIKEPYPYTVDFRPIHIDILKDYKIAVGMFKESYFGILDNQNNIVSSVFDYPFTYKGIDGIYRGMVYQTRVKANREQNKFVILTMASDIFEIYECRNSEISKIYTSPFKHVPQVKNMGRRYIIDGDKSIIGFVNSSVTDEYIYFSYLDAKYDDVYKNGLASDEVLCFNWNGNKIKKYILPFRIRSFCVDDNYIYGVSCENDDMVVYKFDLK